MKPNRHLVGGPKKLNKAYGTQEYSISGSNTADTAASNQSRENNIIKTPQKATGGPFDKPGGKSALGA